MMKHAFLILLLLIGLPYMAWMQSTAPTEKISVYAEEDQYEDDPYYWSYSREVGVNFTPLISKLVPFNLGENDAGNVGLIWKKYYSSRAFRISLGAKLRNFDDGTGNNFFFLGIGLEKRHPITKDKKMAYTSGWELFLNASEVENDNALGVRKTYGFEYHFTKRLFISTEAALFLGLNADEGGPVFDYQIPTAIFVNIRLY
ncbi:MAG: hypothetical protein IPN89_02915 [Saprospiraceae bacterium]|nr:hypothetical protein [Saprospiraceae bacterium]